MKTIFANKARQTHCKRGHELSGDNLRNSFGHRRCKECARLVKRTNYLVQKYFKGLILIIAFLVLGATASGQTINSDGVSVRNSAPANVFFMFPAGESNVVEIQMACSDSPANPNWVFVYEEQPDGQIVTYPSKTTINCSETIGTGGTTYSATLEDPITVHTPDHTITIDSAAWTAVKKTGYHGYYWGASGGSSTLTIN